MNGLVEPLKVGISEWDWLGLHYQRGESGKVSAAASYLFFQTYFFKCTHAIGERRGKTEQMSSYRCTYRLFRLYLHCVYIQCMPKRHTMFSVVLKSIDPQTSHNKKSHNKKKKRVSFFSIWVVVQAEQGQGKRVSVFASGHHQDNCRVFSEHLGLGSIKSKPQTITSFKSQKTPQKEPPHLPLIVKSLKRLSHSVSCRGTRQPVFSSPTVPPQGK